MTVFREPESPASPSSSSAAPRARRRQLLPRPVLDAVAGAVSGGVARVVVSPLDVIKIRFQVQLEPIHTPHAAGPAASLAGAGRAAAMAAAGAARASKSKYTGLVQAAREILREEGVQGFWRGTVPGLLLVMPYTAIQFVVIHRFKSLMTGSHRTEDHKQLRPELSFVGGSVAGIAATVGSYPFDLLRTVLASQGEPKVYSGMRAACAGIVRERGVRGLFAGLAPTIVEIIPYAGLQFGLYDGFKRQLAHYNWSRSKAYHDLPVSLAHSTHPPSPSPPSTAPSLSQPPSPSPSSSAASPVLPAAVERRVSSTPSPGHLTPWQQFLCGLAAGTLAKVACHPSMSSRRGSKWRGCCATLATEPASSRGRTGA
ncbi:hypothetical protein CLOM_g19616 [Closterium sp. NIES-68]|nr:hypothetical protein CLOM_g19616 [Closterium sp. NIES-68]